MRICTVFWATLNELGPKLPLFDSPLDSLSTTSFRNICPLANNTRTGLRLDAVADARCWVESIGKKVSETGTSRADSFKRDLRIAIRRSGVASLSNGDRAADEDVVSFSHKSLQISIHVRDDGRVDVSEVVVFDQGAGRFADVEAGSRDILVAAGVDVTGSEANRRCTGVDVVPPVVMVGHAKVSTILSTVACRVTDQRSLPLYTVIGVSAGIEYRRGKRTYVIRKCVPRDSDKVACVGDVKLSVIIVLVSNDTIVTELVMVYPYIDGLVQSERITALSGIAEAEISNDDIADTSDTKTTADEALVER